MAKTEINIEEFFTNAGIKWEKKEWLYLCQLEERQFYYSPQTGKWRMKGKRGCKFSQSPEDFINQALQYLPPNSQSDQTSSNNQAKNQQKGSEKKSQAKQKKQPSYSDYGSDFKNSQFDFHAENVQGIRLQFLKVFEECLKIQRERKYKIGWIGYYLAKEFALRPEEICWLCVICGNAPGWAFHTMKDAYRKANWAEILKIIDENQKQWLEEAKNRWGIEDNFSQKKSKQKQSAETQKVNQEALSYEAYLKTLKITFPFNRQELKAAYRRRALETHPDSGGTAEDFRQVDTAYQMLLTLLNV